MTDEIRTTIRTRTQIDSPTRWRIDETTLHGRRAVENAALLAHEANRAYCTAIGDKSQVPFAQAPQWQLDSVFDGVRQILHSPDTTPEQSHENWTKKKLADGWTYGEVKDAEKKTHHCLVPYDQLPPSQRYKDAIFGAAVREAFFLYEQRAFEDRETRLPVYQTPYAAHDRSKQTGLVVAIGRTNRMVFRVVHAYLEATGYPAMTHPSAPLHGMNDAAVQMVIYGLSTPDVRTAYDSWCRMQWPTLHPDLPWPYVSPGPGGTHTHDHRTLVQWHLIYGLAQAMAQIEGLVFERAEERYIRSMVWKMETESIKEIAHAADREALDRLRSAQAIIPDVSTP